MQNGRNLDLTLKWVPFQTNNMDRRLIQFTLGMGPWMWCTCLINNLLLLCLSGTNWIKFSQTLSEKQYIKTGEGHSQINSKQIFSTFLEFPLLCHFLPINLFCSFALLRRRTHNHFFFWKPVQGLRIGCHNNEKKHKNYKIILWD